MSKVNKVGVSYHSLKVAIKASVFFRSWVKVGKAGVGDRCFTKNHYVR